MQPAQVTVLACQQHPIHVQKAAANLAAGGFMIVRGNRSIPLYVPSLDREASTHDLKPSATSCKP
eukprot:1158569-Pelagomonas_calceolata.AAC.3